MLQSPAPVRSCNSFALLLQHRAVGDLLGQRMLEDVFHFGKGRLLVEKLFALQRGQQAVQFVFGLGDHLADQAQRKLFGQ